MNEMINWLDTFTVGERVVGMVPPGTNTVYVEIEYSDGTVAKCGTDTIKVIGVLYYTNCDYRPDALYRALSKVSLS